MKMKSRILEFVAARLDGFITRNMHIGASTSRGASFHSFGAGSIVMYPFANVYNESYIKIGEGTIIGPNVSLAAGMVPGQICLTNPVVVIGDRCLIGRDSGIVGHLEITKTSSRRIRIRVIATRSSRQKWQRCAPSSPSTCAN